MKGVLIRLGSDFLSTIVFLVVYLTTDDVIIATLVALAVTAAQIIYTRVSRQSLDAMTYASMALVITLGVATLLTNDPRFVLAKPAIGHFAVGAIMLRKNWMSRYSPDIVRDTIPHLVTAAGYAWSALMFLLGLGTIAIAMTGDVKLWALYVSVISVGAKIAAFMIQYVAFRIIVTRKLRNKAQHGWTASGPAH